MNGDYGSLEEGDYVVTSGKKLYNNSDDAKNETNVTEALSKSLNLNLKLVPREVSFHS